MKIKHITYLGAGLLLSLWSCKSNDDIPLSKEPQMLKISAPILVSPDSTVIVLADYFLRPKAIDSLEIDKSLGATISSDSVEMVIRPKDRDFPRLSVLKIWSGGFPYSLLLERSAKMRYRFTFDPKNRKYKHVQIKGQMNEWNAAAGYLFEKDGKWHIDLQLFPGKYQYKLILDGKEKSDPGNRDSVSNNMGGYNSLLTLGNLNPAGLPVLFTSVADGRKITIGLKNKADSVFVFWQNHLLDHNFWKMDSSGLTLEVPRKAKEFDRSFIRAWAYNSTGISNEILVPLQDGKVLGDAGKLTRGDREAMVMYFLMIDRFKDGNPGNDAPVKDKDIDPRVNTWAATLPGSRARSRTATFQTLGSTRSGFRPSPRIRWLDLTNIPPPTVNFQDIMATGRSH